MPRGGWQRDELRTLTDVAAYWKKGKRPEDHAGRSLLRLSGWREWNRCKRQLWPRCGAAGGAHADRGKDVRVDVERSLVHARRQGRVQALREPLGDGELVRDHLELRVPLQALPSPQMSSCEPEQAIGRTLSSLAAWRKRAACGGQRHARRSGSTTRRD